MPLSSELQATFANILNIEMVQSQRLLELLHQEFELLKEPPSDALENLLEQKKQTLIEVEQCVTQHNQLLNSQGFTPDRKGTEAFLQQCTNSEPLTQQWAQFRSLLEQCQKQNELNGGAVQLNQHQVRQALDVLRGFTNNNKTYGPGGESRPTTSSKSLGKA
jgi:flagellar biosynthesis/type III secretory pathway chaperone